MKKMNALAVCAALVSAGVVLPAHATLTTYTDKAAFLAAAGSVTTEDFSAATVGFSSANYSGNFTGFSLSSVANGDNSGIATGSLTGGDNTPIPGAFAGQNFYGWGEGSDGGVGPTTTFQFTQATTAFGFDWFNTDETDAYSLTVNGLTQNVLTYAPWPNPATGFFGIIATGGETFSTATIQTADFGGFISTEGLDNVLVSGASVPEPTSIALFGIAAAGLFASRKRAK